jgi:hypothetical protein
MKKFLLKATTFSVVALSLIISLEAEASIYVQDLGGGTTYYSGDLNGYSMDLGNGTTYYSGDLNGFSMDLGGGLTYHDFD